MTSSAHGAGARMGATSTMTARLTRRALTEIAPIRASVSRNAALAPSVKRCRTPPRANAPREQESSIRPMWPVCQLRWICQQSAASEIQIARSD